jgi:glyoxylase-like metal-dependent hydrolase (beta-lactamase superfamily II)
MAVHERLALPPGMHLFERDWLSSNGVLIVDRDSATLIDTGYVKHAALTQALVANTLGSRALDRVINTHLHSDHCGGNALLRRTWGCQIVVPRASIAAVNAWDAERLSFRATGQRCEPFIADAALEPGSIIRLGGIDWEVIAAPGHDPDSVVLWCEEYRILISADALWQRGFGVIFPELTKPGVPSERSALSGPDSGGELGAFDEQRAILDRIAKLKVRWVIPGHGPAFDEVGRALDSAYSLLDTLCAEPERNARHAVKVLLKFLLLDQERIDLASLPNWFGSIGLVRAANQHYLRYNDGSSLTDWAVSALVASGAARIEDGTLLNP